MVLTVKPMHQLLMVESTIRVSVAFSLTSVNT
jgi:hypothetical protein